MGQKFGTAKLVSSVDFLIDLSSEEVERIWLNYNLHGNPFTITLNTTKSIFWGVDGKGKKLYGDDKLKDFFSLMDDLGQSTIDSLEVMSCISILSCMDTVDKLNFIFNLYDFDEEEEISVDTVTMMFRNICNVLRKLDVNYEEESLAGGSSSIQLGTLNSSSTIIDKNGTEHLAEVDMYDLIQEAADEMAHLACFPLSQEEGLSLIPIEEDEDLDQDNEENSRPRTTPGVTHIDINGESSPSSVVQRPSSEPVMTAQEKKKRKNTSREELKVELLKLDSDKKDYEEEDLPHMAEVPLRISASHFAKFCASHPICCTWLRYYSNSKAIISKDMELSAGFSSDSFSGSGAGKLQPNLRRKPSIITSSVQAWERRGTHAIRDFAASLVAEMEAGNTEDETKISLPKWSAFTRAALPVDNGDGQNRALLDKVPEEVLAAFRRRDPSIIHNKQQPPEDVLKINTIYGYNSTGRANLHYGRSGATIIYSVSSFVLITMMPTTYRDASHDKYQRWHHRQRIITDHAGTEVTCVALTLDHRLGASASLPGTSTTAKIVVFSAADGAIKGVIHPTGTAASGTITLDFSGDTSRLLALSNDKMHTITVYDTSSLHVVYVSYLGIGHVYDAVMLGTPCMFAVACRTQTSPDDDCNSGIDFYVEEGGSFLSPISMPLYDRKSALSYPDLPAEDTAGDSMNISPNSKLPSSIHATTLCKFDLPDEMLSANDAGEIMYWRGRYCIQRLKGHDSAVLCLSYDHESNTVASGAVDGTVNVYKLTSEIDLDMARILLPSALQQPARRLARSVRINTLAKISPDMILPNPLAAVRSVSIRSDGAAIVVGLGDGGIYEFACRNFTSNIPDKDTLLLVPTGGLMHGSSIVSTASCLNKDYIEAIADAVPEKAKNDFSSRLLADSVVTSITEIYRNDKTGFDGFAVSGPDGILRVWNLSAANFKTSTIERDLYILDIDSSMPCLDIASCPQHFAAAVEVESDLRTQSITKADVRVIPMKSLFQAIGATKKTKSVSLAKAEGANKIPLPQDQIPAVLCFSPNSDILAVGCTNGRISIFREKVGKKGKRWKLERRIDTQEFGIRICKIDFSLDSVYMRSFNVNRDLQFHRFGTEPEWVIALRQRKGQGDSSSLKERVKELELDRIEINKQRAMEFEATKSKRVAQFQAEERERKAQAKQEGIDYVPLPEPRVTEEEGPESEPMGEEEISLRAQLEQMTAGWESEVALIPHEGMGLLVEQGQEVAAVKWASSTVPASWEIEGIWKDVPQKPSAAWESPLGRCDGNAHIFVTGSATGDLHIYRCPVLWSGLEQMLDEEDSESMDSSRSMLEEDSDIGDFLEDGLVPQQDLTAILQEQLRNIDDAGYRKYLGVEVSRKALAHLGPVSALRFIQNGSILITAGATDGMIMVWTLDEEVGTWDEPPPVATLSKVAIAEDATKATSEEDGGTPAYKNEEEAEGVGVKIGADGVIMVTGLDHLDQPEEETEDDAIVKNLERDPAVVAEEKRKPGEWLTDFENPKDEGYESADDEGQLLDEMWRTRKVGPIGGNSRQFDMGYNTPSAIRMSGTLPWLHKIGASIDKLESDSGKLHRKCPSESLELQWIYGCSSRFAKNAVKFTREGRVLYPASTVAVILDRGALGLRESHEWEQFYFTGHREQICCMDVYTERGIACSAELAASGEFVMINVWHTESLKVIRRIFCTPHPSTTHLNPQRSVWGASSIAFSPCGNFIVVALIDDVHSVVVYEWEQCTSNSLSEQDERRNGTVPRCHLKLMDVTSRVLSLSFSLLTHDASIPNAKEGAISNYTRALRFVCGGANCFNVVDVLATNYTYVKYGIYGEELAGNKKPSIHSSIGYPASGALASECEFLLGMSNGFLGLVPPGSRSISRTVEVKEKCAVTAMCIMSTGSPLSKKEPLIQFDAHGNKVPVWNASGPSKPVPGAHTLKKFVIAAATVMGHFLLFDGSLEPLIYFNVYDMPFGLSPLGRYRGITSLSGDAFGVRLIFATSCGEISEVDVFRQIDMYSGNPIVVGHGREQTYGMAIHPFKEQCATVGYDRMLRVWDLSLRVPYSSAELPGVANSTCFSDDGIFIAVALGGMMSRRGLWHKKKRGAIGFTEFVDAIRSNGEVSLKKVDLRSEWIKADKPLGKVLIFRWDDVFSNLQQIFDLPQSDIHDTISCMLFAPDNAIFFVGCLNGDVLLYDPNEDFQLLHTFKGAKEGIKFMEIDEEMSHLLTTGEHGELCTWSLKEGVRIGGFEAYRIAKDTKIINRSNPRWHDTLGVFGSGVASSSVQKVAITSDKKLVAAGGRDGRIRLYDYKATHLPLAESREYIAHSGLIGRWMSGIHGDAGMGVANISFTQNCKYLLSQGAEDRCLFQWKVQRKLREIESYEDRMRERLNNIYTAIDEAEDEKLFIEKELADEKETLAREDADDARNWHLLSDEEKADRLEERENFRQMREERRAISASERAETRISFVRPSKTAPSQSKGMSVYFADEVDRPGSALVSTLGEDANAKADSKDSKVKGDIKSFSLPLVGEKKESNKSKGIVKGTLDSTASKKDRSANDDLKGDKKDVPGDDEEKEGEDDKSERSFWTGSEMSDRSLGTFWTDSRPDTGDSYSSYYSSRSGSRYTESSRSSRSFSSHSGSRSIRSAWTEYSTSSMGSRSGDRSRNRSRGRTPLDIWPDSRGPSRGSGVYTPNSVRDRLIGTDAEAPPLLRLDSGFDIQDPVLPESVDIDKIVATLSAGENSEAVPVLPNSAPAATSNVVHQKNNRSNTAPELSGRPNSGKVVKEEQQMNERKRIQGAIQDPFVVGEDEIALATHRPDCVAALQAAFNISLVYRGVDFGHSAMEVIAAAAWDLKNATKQEQKSEEEKAKKRGGGDRMQPGTRRRSTLRKSIVETRRRLSTTISRRKSSVSSLSVLGRLQKLQLRYNSSGWTNSTEASQSLAGSSLKVTFTLGGVLASSVVARSSRAALEWITLSTLGGFSEIPDISLQDTLAHEGGILPADVRGYPSKSEMLLVNTPQPLPAVYIGDGKIALLTVSSVLNMSPNLRGTAGRLLTMMQMSDSKVDVGDDSEHIYYLGLSCFAVTKDSRYLLLISGKIKYNSRESLSKEFKKNEDILAERRQKIAEAEAASKPTIALPSVFMDNDEDADKEEGDEEGEAEGTKDASDAKKKKRDKDSDELTSDVDEKSGSEGGDDDGNESEAKGIKEEPVEGKAEEDHVDDEIIEDKSESPSEVEAEAPSQGDRSDEQGKDIVAAEDSEDPAIPDEKEREDAEQVTGANEPIVELEPEQFQPRSTATHLSNLTIIDTRTGVMICELETDLLGAGCCASFSHCGTLLSVVVGDPLSGYHMIVYESPGGSWKDAYMLCKTAISADVVRTISFLPQMSHNELTPMNAPPPGFEVKPRKKKIKKWKLMDDLEKRARWNEMDEEERDLMWPKLKLEDKNSLWVGMDMLLRTKVWRNLDQEGRRERWYYMRNDEKVITWRSRYSKKEQLSHWMEMDSRDRSLVFEEMKEIKIKYKFYRMLDDVMRRDLLELLHPDVRKDLKTDFKPARKKFKKKALQKAADKEAEEKLKAEKEAKEAAEGGVKGRKEDSDNDDEDDQDESSSDESSSDDSDSDSDDDESSEEDVDRPDSGSDFDFDHLYSSEEEREIAEKARILEEALEAELAAKAALDTESLDDTSVLTGAETADGTVAVPKNDEIEDKGEVKANATKEDTDTATDVERKAVEEDPGNEADDEAEIGDDDDGSLTGDAEKDGDVAEGGDNQEESEDEDEEDAITRLEKSRPYDEFQIVTGGTGPTSLLFWSLRGRTLHCKPAVQSIPNMNMEPDDHWWATIGADLDAAKKEADAIAEAEAEEENEEAKDPWANPDSDEEREAAAKAAEEAEGEEAEEAEEEEEVVKEDTEYKIPIPEFFETAARTPAVSCLVTLGADLTMTGHTDGSIAIWHKNLLIQQLERAHAAPVMSGASSQRGSLPMQVWKEEDLQGSIVATGSIDSVRLWRLEVTFKDEVEEALDDIENEESKSLDVIQAPEEVQEDGEEKEQEEDQEAIMPTPMIDISPEFPVKEAGRTPARVVDRNSCDLRLIKEFPISDLCSRLAPIYSVALKDNMTEALAPASALDAEGVAGEQVNTIADSTGVAVTSLSLDGLSYRLLITLSCNALLELVTDTGAVRVLSEGHRVGGVTSLQAHPTDALTAFTCGGDGTIRIWSLAPLVEAKDNSHSPVHTQGYGHKVAHTAKGAVAGSLETYQLGGPVGSEGFRRPLDMAITKTMVGEALAIALDAPPPLEMELAPGFNFDREETTQPGLVLVMTYDATERSSRFPGQPLSTITTPLLSKLALVSTGSGTVDHVRFNPSGSILAASSSDASVELFMMLHDNHSVAFEKVGVIPNHTYTLNAFDFSADGRYLRTFSGFHHGLMEAWCVSHRAEIARVHKARQAMDELKKRRESYRKEMSSRGVRVNMDIAKGDTIANIDAPDPMADITQKVASLESVGLGRAAELRIGPLEPRSTSLPCTTRYFDLQHRRRGAAAEDVRRGGASDLALDNEVTESSSLTIEEIIDSETDRMIWRDWRASEDERRRQLLKEAKSGGMFGNKKAKAAEEELKKLGAPEPEFGNGAGSTLDQLARCRWATATCPAAPEALTVVYIDSIAATRGVIKGSGEDNALKAIQEEDSDTITQEPSDLLSLSEDQSSTSIVLGVDAAQIAGEAIEKIDQAGPFIPFIEEVCCKLHPKIGFVVIACFSDGSISIHQPKNSSSHTNTQGEAVTRVHAHAYGGVYATFTANAEAVLTAGKRDGAVVIWQIGEEEKKNDY